MSKYIGATVVNLSVDTVDVTGDITSTDATPEVIIVNDTHEDTDGGREGKVTFKGQQSGGEETTLAQIQASHDGTSDDEKGDLIFKTNDGSDGAAPTEAMRIDSSGNVGIGTADPHDAGANFNMLTLNGPKGGGIVFSDDDVNQHMINTTDDNSLRFTRGSGLSDETMRVNSAGEIQIGGGTNAGFIDFDGTSLQLNTQRNPNTGTFVNTGRSHASIALNGSSADSSVRFYTKDSNNATASERWRITKDGHLKAMSDGLGIDFSASEGSGASSSVLDDYEEGTWTPTFLDANSTSQAITNVSGEYTKIGNTIHVHCVFTRNNTTGTSGTMQIGNLPFAGVSSRIFLSGHVWVDLGGPSSGDEVAAAYNGGGTVVYGVKSTTSAQQANVRYIEYQQVTNSRFVYMSLVYRTS